MDVVDGGKSPGPSKAKSIKEQAQAEIARERSEKYVADLKKKLRELESAKIVVSNLEREIEELELKIDQEVNAIR